MRLTEDRIRKIIREEIKNMLDNKNTQDVEAKEGVWSGGENLENSVDYVEVQSVNESIDYCDYKLVFKS